MTIVYLIYSSNFPESVFIHGIFTDKDKVLELCENNFYDFVAFETDDFNEEGVFVS